MRVFRFFSVFAALMIALSTMAQAQEKVRLSSLPENATLQETQDWLIKAITQNSVFRVKSNQSVKNVGLGRIGGSNVERSMYAETRVLELKFKGCQMSYALETLTATDASSSGSGSTPQRGSIGSMGK